MKSSRWILTLPVLAVLAWAATADAKQPTCDPTAIAAAKAAVDAACPCAGQPDGLGGTVPWKNHGQYVKCVAKATKSQSKGAGVARKCVKDVVPCAANSTCGKTDDVACIITTGTCGFVGTCTGGQGCQLDTDCPIGETCTLVGTCDNEAKVCTTDADCSVQSCAVMSAEECTLSQGSAATGTCCSQ
jgi:hypothetical protein